jgi:hypothetical protein
MSLLRRLSRLESIAVPANFDEVIERMTMRTKVELLKFQNSTGKSEINLPKEAEKLLGEDTDAQRRADQTAWETYARANRLTNILAVEGRLIIPLAARLQHYRANPVLRNPITIADQRRQE